MISTPDKSEKPRKSPAMPPNDTKRSTHPKSTSRLYRMMGHVKNSILTWKSSCLWEFWVTVLMLQRMMENVTTFYCEFCFDTRDQVLFSHTCLKTFRSRKPYWGSSVHSECIHWLSLCCCDVWRDIQIHSVYIVCTSLKWAGRMAECICKACWLSPCGIVSCTSKTSRCRSCSSLNRLPPRKCISAARWWAVPRRQSCMSASWWLGDPRNFLLPTKTAGVCRD